MTPQREAALADYIERLMPDIMELAEAMLLNEVMREHYLA